MAATSGIDFIISIPEIYMDKSGKIKQSVWDVINQETFEYMFMRYANTFVPYKQEHVYVALSDDTARRGNQIFSLKMTPQGLHFSYVYRGEPTPEDREAAAYMKTAIQKVIAASGSATGMMTAPAIPQNVLAKSQMPPEIMDLIASTAGEQKRENPLKVLANSQEKRWWEVWKGGARKSRKVNRKHKRKVNRKTNRNHKRYRK